MRISVRKHDKGYKVDAFLYEAYLDGKKVDDCFTADEEKREVFVFVHDKNGELILTDDKEKLIEKRLTGKVEIRQCKQENLTAQ